MPEIDPSIFGECQAMLLNFDEMLEREFGRKYCIRQSLSFALQIYPSAENLIEAVKRNRAAKAAAQFVEQYRSSLSPEIYGNGKYAFKAFLIQVANHESQDALPIRFVHYDKLTAEQKEALTPFSVMVKYRQPPIANIDMMPAGKVTRRVQEALGDPKVMRGRKQIDKFNLGWHTKCWRHYKIRPPAGSENPEKTETNFCIYDKRHDDYSYTEQWIKFLVDEFRDPNAYDRLFEKSKGLI